VLTKPLIGLQVAPKMVPFGIKPTVEDLVVGALRSHTPHGGFAAPFAIHVQLYAAFGDAGAVEPGMVDVVTDVVALVWLGAAGIVVGLRTSGAALAGSGCSRPQPTKAPNIAEYSRTQRHSDAALAAELCPARPWANGRVAELSLVMFGTDWLIAVLVPADRVRREAGASDWLAHGVRCFKAWSSGGASGISRSTERAGI
jgi:hypothetical protein